MNPAPDAERLRSIIAVASEIAASRLDLDAIVQLVGERAASLTGARAGAVELTGDAGAVPEQGAGSMICVPLRHRGESVGVLKVTSPAANAFDDGDSETLELLSGLVAAHLTTPGEAGAEERPDALTGLPGPRAFEATLRSEVARASRYGLRLSLALLDVDHLDRIRALHGHEAADAVLLRVAGVLRGVRASDMAFRLGDDEFALLLPNTPYHSARGVAERAAADVGPCGLPAGRVTLSTGVAEARSADPPGLLLAARGALSRAKARSRGGLRAA